MDNTQTLWTPAPIHWNCESAIPTCPHPSSHQQSTQLPFKVMHGVRQGDPLSCPLFDLAIEPLACKIRNNPEIHSLIIPGLADKLVINLFTDNTTLYLSECDSFDVVEPKLKEWCKVSGAKFNIKKMEIIPLGTQNNTITTQKINPHDQTPLDTCIHISKDREAVISLRAWIGNHAVDLTPWELTLDKMRKKIEPWKRSNITLYGKRLMIQAIIGGLTQFLAMAQGMLVHIKAAITHKIRDFIWDNNTALRMALKYLEKPIK